MSEDEEKIRKAMNVMAQEPVKEKILTPIETVERLINRCEQDGFKVAALAFGQIAFVAFARDLERNKPKKLRLVDAEGAEIGNDDVEDVKMWKGIKVYKNQLQA